MLLSVWLPGLLRGLQFSEPGWGLGAALRPGCAGGLRGPETWGLLVLWCDRRYNTVVSLGPAVYWLWAFEPVTESACALSYFYLWNEHSDGSYLIELFGRASELIYVDCLQQCPSYSKSYVYMCVINKNKICNSLCWWEDSIKHSQNSAGMWQGRSKHERLLWWKWQRQPEEDELWSRILPGGAWWSAFPLMWFSVRSRLYLLIPTWSQREYICRNAFLFEYAKAAQLNRHPGHNWLTISHFWTEDEMLVSVWLPWVPGTSPPSNV